MKINLDRNEVEELVEVLERRISSIGRRIHRFVNPTCELCKSEAIILKKLKDANQEDSAP